MIIDNPTILVVDDDDCAATLVSTVFERAGLVQPLQFAPRWRGGDRVSERRGRCSADRAQYPLPTVMLLDLNMPRKNGFEVLAWLRKKQPSRSKDCTFMS